MLSRIIRVMKFLLLAALKAGCTAHLPTSRDWLYRLHLHWVGLVSLHRCIRPRSLSGTTDPTGIALGLQVTATFLRSLLTRILDNISLVPQFSSSLADFFRWFHNAFQLGIRRDPIR